MHNEGVHRNIVSDTMKHLEWHLYLSCFAPILPGALPPLSGGNVTAANNCPSPLDYFGWLGCQVTVVPMLSDLVAIPTPVQNCSQLLSPNKRHKALRTPARPQLIATRAWPLSRDACKIKYDFRTYTHTDMQHMYKRVWVQC